MGSLGESMMMPACLPLRHGTKKCSANITQDSSQVDEAPKHPKLCINACTICMQSIFDFRWNCSFDFRV
jgi:hypothetical protein